MHEGREEISARLSQNMASFDGLNQGFGGVANTIKKFGIVAAEVIGGGLHLVQNSLSTSPVTLPNCYKRRWRRSLGQPGGQQGFGQLYNQVLGKPIAFPTPQSNLYIIRLWAHGTAGYQT